MIVGAAEIPIHRGLVTIVYQLSGYREQRANRRQYSVGSRQEAGESQIAESEKGIENSARGIE